MADCCIADMNGELALHASGQVSGDFSDSAKLSLSTCNVLMFYFFFVAFIVRYFLQEYGRYRGTRPYVGDPFPCSNREPPLMLSKSAVSLNVRSFSR